MQLETYSYTNKKWDKKLNQELDSKNTLIIIFGDPNTGNIKDGFDEIKNDFKNSTLMGASTSGEIFGDELQDNSLVVSIMKFNHTKVKLTTCDIENQSSSYADGISISKNLDNDQLKAIFVLCVGLNVNGSKFIQGMSSILDRSIPITGGLAGDGSDFKSTWVIANNEILTNKIVAVGFYGDNIHVKYGSQGGWESLGIERIVR